MSPTGHFTIADENFSSKALNWNQLHETSFLHQCPPLIWTMCLTSRSSQRWCTRCRARIKHKLHMLIQSILILFDWIGSCLLCSDVFIRFLPSSIKFSLLFLVDLPAIRKSQFLSWFKVGSWSSWGLSGPLQAHEVALRKNDYLSYSMSPRSYYIPLEYSIRTNSLSDKSINLDTWATINKQLLPELRVDLT